MGRPNKGAAPPTWKLMLLKWLGLFPLILIISYGLEWLNVKPLWLKLLVETVILVPIINYVITPLMDSVFSEWLYAGVDEQQQHKSIDIGS